MTYFEKQTNTHTNKQTKQQSLIRQWEYIYTYIYIYICWSTTKQEWTFIKKTSITNIISLRRRISYWSIYKNKLAIKEIYWQIKDGSKYNNHSNELAELQSTIENNNNNNNNSVQYGAQEELGIRKVTHTSFVLLVVHLTSHLCLTSF